MRFKKLTKEQIIISLDRLTRFKNTREKYLRVFSDILLTNLIEPKLRKQDISDLDFNLLISYVAEIFNASLDKKYPQSNIINNYIKNYENSIFNNCSDTQVLLSSNIDYENTVDLITEDSPINLKWLKFIIKNKDLLNKDAIFEKRRKLLLKFPIERVVLVEGITEEILLPVFARYLGHDFYAEGIQIIPAGGKNQVVKMYYKLAEELKIPVFILLDKDAEENIAQIKPRLRKFDKIHLVSCGEFEDLLPKALIMKTINSHFENFSSISANDFIEDQPTAKVLEEFFKKKGLHEFKKAEFAKLVKNMIQNDEDVSTEIRNIIAEIMV